MEQYRGLWPSILRRNSTHPTKPRPGSLVIDRHRLQKTRNQVVTRDRRRELHDFAVGKQRLDLREHHLGHADVACHRLGVGEHRAILRIGTYELLWRDDIPDAVAISEAVALAQELSTDESSSFVNGVLGRLLELKPRLSIDS